MPEVSVTSTPQNEKTVNRSGKRSGFLLPLGRGWSLDPMSMMREISEEMDRFLRGINGESATETWLPAIDLDRSNGKLVVSAELPGVRKEDIKVEVGDGELYLSGERNEESKEDREGYHRRERRYGQFFRSVPLPEGAKLDQIQADLKDGVLKVSIPVPEIEKKTRQIPVKD